jgi:N-acetylglucosaminyl-diphospho-decaprenol L-rhamnosyltransferase
MSISIIIPLYNQLEYTKSCLDSLFANGLNGAHLLLIDNGSSDGTSEYLASNPNITFIANRENLGCAGAWNQGVRETDSDWLVFLNNDVIVSPGWLDGLAAFASKEKLDLVSPAIREGELNYNVVSYAKEFVGKMTGFNRLGVVDGICFMVRRQVFATIGLFDENFRIGQFEDTDFFRRAKAAGFRLGTTGQSFIHHFGSVTQNSIRQSKKVRPYEAENRAYYRQKWQLNWWRRFKEKRLARWRELGWRTAERLRQGHTLKEKWLGGRLRYF